MDFINFIRNVRKGLFDQCDRAALQRLGRSLDRQGIDLKTLLINNDAAVSGFKAETLAALADLHRDFTKWKEAAKNLRRALAASKLVLPDGSVLLTHDAREVEALERVARLCQRSGHANHDAWLTATKAHVELWRASVSLSLSEGVVSVKFKDAAHADAEDFEGYVSSKEVIEDLAGYKWLAARRGEKAGILETSLELPWPKIVAQAEARLSMLGLAAQKRGAQSIVDELIADDLETAVRLTLTEKSERQAFSTARTAYLGLLNTPPLQASTAVSIYVNESKDAAAAAVLDRRGDILAHLEVPAGDDLKGAVASLIAEHSPEAVVLPVTCEDKKRLSEVQEILGDLPTQWIHDIALSEARKNLSIGKQEGSAVVLGRRALKPGREWGRVDPLSLRLGEFTREVDPEELREILAEAKALSSWDRRNKNKGSTKKGKGTGRLAVLPAGKRINSFLKSIRDLKPGMTLDGVITNITRFGAFVNIGLSVEGMIHVSQLSMEFVEDPAQVVRIGEQVKARVLEVVPEKQRIALSLKPAPDFTRPEMRPPMPGQRAPLPPGGGRAAPKTRSAALADLDALFKK
jgi:transcriptional accessory protein Tex/SPT6